jgi:hypothetical protein
VCVACQVTPRYPDGQAMARCDELFTQEASKAGQQDAYQTFPSRVFRRGNQAGNKGSGNHVDMHLLFAAIYALTACTGTSGHVVADIQLTSKAPSIWLSACLPVSVAQKVSCTLSLPRSYVMHLGSAYDCGVCRVLFVFETALQTHS